jgi:hypothetical protein
MTYEITYRLHPPSAFGLPGDDYTVVPGGPDGVREIHSPTIDVLTGNQLREGTVSRYRDDAGKVSLSLVQTPFTGTLVDNLLTLSAVEGDPDDLLARSRAVADSLSVWMSHHLTCIVYPELVQFVNRSQQVVIPTPRTRQLLKVRYYHVPTIAQGVRQWLDTAVSDRLLAALRYYRMGLFLLEQGQEGYNDFRSQLLSEAVLNFYKSVSALLGDPSAGDRDWQSRYRQLGLSQKFFTSEVEWLRKEIRNNGGVAHYRLKLVPIDEMWAWATRAREIAQQVVERAKSAG